jgi:hypothetical protein
MANVSRVYGLRPVKHLSGAAWNGATEAFAFLTGDATAAYVGDLVKIGGSADANGVLQASRATVNTDPLLGVVVGFVPDYSNLNAPSGYRAASTARTAFVVVDPTIVYEIQADAAAAIADIGLNVGITFTAGSATTGLSGLTANMASKATTATLPLKSIGFRQSPDQDMSDSTSWKLLVTVNTNVFGSAGTVGA